MLTGVPFPPTSSEFSMDQPFADHGQWFERHRPYLLLLTRAQLQSRNPGRLNSSDVVQQTLLDAYAKREQFRGTTDGERAAWLREILKHNLADALRDQLRDKRDVRREQSLEGAIDASFSRTQDWLAAVQSSPSQKVVRQEDLLRLSEALLALPKAQREAIVLHHIQGMKLTDVAVELDRTEAAVAGLLFRGLKALESILGE